MDQNIVNLLGAGAGFDTQALVKQLVEVERSAPQQRIDNNRTRVETQISDYGLLNSALSTLKDAADTIGNPETFNTKNASFTESNAFIPVSLDADVQAGDYAFTVSQLAQSQSLASATFENATDTIGTGILSFSLGQWDVVTPPATPTTFTQDSNTNTVNITIDAGNNTLEGLANAINEADFGVQASILNDGSGYRLVMLAESGLNNQLQITASETGGSPTNTDNEGLSRFAFTSGAFQMTQNQVGQDATFTVNGLSVSRETNTINDVVPGFEFTLSDETTGGEVVTVNISDDKAAGEQIIRDFVDAYNAFLETVEPLIGFNQEENTRGSLATDSLAKSMPSRVRELLSSDVSGVTSDFSALASIGIRTELDGSISIDETTFKAAINNNYEQFKNLFTSSTQTTNDNIFINSSNANTTSGQYEVEVTTQPARGQLVGAAASEAAILAGLSANVPTSASLTGAANTALLSDFVASSGRFQGGAATIPLNLATQGAGANDYDFSITVDGVSSAANISVPVADYVDNDALATALEISINNDLNIIGLSVTYDGSGFVFTSSETGAVSNVSLSAVGANADQLGISTGSSIVGTGGANDYDFTLAVDGVTSGTISLTPGTYASFGDLATHIQGQINADATLSGAGASVNVSHNGTSFVIASTSTGVSSTLANATAVGPQAASLGITSGALVQGAGSGGNTDAYDFQITVDGNTSGTISLTSGVYADMNAVAQMMEERINADPTLGQSASTVDVSYDVDNDQFSIVSRRYGTSSSVSVTEIGTNAAELGLAAGTATGGVNAAGKINGVEAFGSGNVLLPALGQPGEGLGVIIGETATTATVNFSRGLGEELSLLIDQFLSSNGLIASRESALTSDLEGFDQDQSNLDRRIESYEQRLSAQFIAMEAIVRSLQNSSDFLETTLESLLNIGRE